MRLWWMVLDAITLGRHRSVRARHAETVAAHRRLTAAVDEHLTADRRLRQRLDGAPVDAAVPEVIEPSAEPPPVGPASGWLGIGAASAAVAAAVPAIAWALVGALGRASTGVAIAALEGAAAHDATLAWFGGGALADGGGGMALGSLVLLLWGLAPALAVLVVGSRLHADRLLADLDERHEQYVDEADQARTARDLCRDLERRAELRQRSSAQPTRE